MPADVQITQAADGTVLIAGEAAGPPFTRAVLDVAGAVLTWPVLGAPGLPTAEIHDAERAQQWLWAVYGTRTAAAVHDLVTGTPTGLTVTAEVTPLARRAAQLALGHWASRWWPASYLDQIPALDPDLTGLELAARTHECQQLFDDLDDQPDGSAAALIEDHQVALDPLIRWWRSTAPDSRVDGVVRMIDEAAGNAGLDSEPLRRLHSALDRHSVPTGTSLDIRALFGPQGEYALAAGDHLDPGGRVIARGVGTNDWCRYPPGFVDAAENAVSWTVSAVGAERRIEIDVVAGSANPVDSVRLAAEVGVNGGPPIRVLLTRRNDVWTGRTNLAIPAAVTPRIEVELLLPGFDPGGSTGDPAGDLAARDAIRALARHRLAAAAADQDTTAEPTLAEIAAAAVDEDF